MSVNKRIRSLWQGFDILLLLAIMALLTFYWVHTWSATEQPQVESLLQPEGLPVPDNPVSDSRESGYPAKEVGGVIRVSLGNQEPGRQAVAGSQWSGRDRTTHTPGMSINMRELESGRRYEVAVMLSPTLQADQALLAESSNLLTLRVLEPQTGQYLHQYVRIPCEGSNSTLSQTFSNGLWRILVGME